MPKPSLAELIAAQAAGTPKSRRRRSAPPPVDAAKGEAVKQAPALADKRPAELARALFVRRFVSAYLKHNMNAAQALRSVRKDVTKRSSRELAHRLLESDDARAELLRQLRGLSTHADLDEEWVYAQWRAMADANIFDYIDSIDPKTGIVTLKLDKDRLTLEQQLAIRRLKFDVKGRVADLELVDRSRAVDSVARARQMFRELEDESDEGITKLITERMQKASKLLPPPRTFDGTTGKEIKPLVDVDDG